MDGSRVTFLALILASSIVVLPVRASLSIATPTNATQCETAPITWEGGQPPFTLCINSDTEEEVIVHDGLNNFDWLVKLPAGTVANITLSDVNNLTTTSDPFTILEGTSTDCLLPGVHPNSPNPGSVATATDTTIAVSPTVVTTTSTSSSSPTSGRPLTSAPTNQTQSSFISTPSLSAGISSLNIKMGSSSALDPANVASSSTTTITSSSTTSTPLQATPATVSPHTSAFSSSSATTLSLPSASTPGSGPSQIADVSQSLSGSSDATSSAVPNGTPSSSASSAKTSLAPGTIAGLGLAAAFVILFALLLLFLCYRRKLRNKRRYTDAPGLPISTPPGAPAPDRASIASSIISVSDHPLLGARRPSPPAPAPSPSSSNKWLTRTLRRLSSRTHAGGSSDSEKSGLGGDGRASAAESFYAGPRSSRGTLRASALLASGAPAGESDVLRPAMSVASMYSDMGGRTLVGEARGVPYGYGPASPYVSSAEGMFDSRSGFAV